MKTPEQLMIPGPTPLPDAVREAMARPAIGHRGGEFKKVLERVFPALQWVFQTRNDVFLITASGTAAMEAALINTLNAGDQILVLSCGVFSERWAETAELLGIRVTRQTVPYGQANSVEALRAALAADTQKAYKAVVITHSETSTSVQNPLEEMAALIRAHGALSIVDAVTSLTASPLPVDAWGLDLVASGSQKGLMIPPGLSFLSVSARAWEAFARCERPGLYFNFKKYKKAQDDFTTPYTPATHLILALDVALKMLQEEGLQACQARHLAHRDAVRNAARQLGLRLLVEDDALASAAVTALFPPPGVDVDALRAGLKQRFGVIVANGQKDLKGKIFRIGHLGFQSERDIRMTLDALTAVLAGLGYHAPSAARGNAPVMSA